MNYHTIVRATFIIAFSSVSAGGAQTIETMQLADRMGAILGSEEACGLTFDQDAISAWIDQSVDPLDLGFPSLLTTQVNLTGYAIDDMTESTKTAHCRAIERSAEALGLMQ